MKTISLKIKHHLREETITEEIITKVEQRKTVSNSKGIREASKIIIEGTRGIKIVLHHPRRGTETMAPTAGCTRLHG